LLPGTFLAEGRLMAGRLATGWPQLADPGWLADPRGPVMALTFLRDMRGETVRDSGRSAGCAVA